MQVESVAISAEDAGGYAAQNTLARFPHDGKIDAEVWVTLNAGGPGSYFVVGGAAPDSGDEAPKKVHASSK